MIIQPKNTRFYANFNRNTLAYGGSIVTTSNTYTDIIIGGAIDISGLYTPIRPTSLIDDLVLNKNLTIFFRFMLTTFNTDAISSPANTRPVVLSYNSYGVSGAFYLHVLEAGYIYLVLNTTYYLIGAIQLNKEYSIALTYNSSAIVVYMNGVKKTTVSGGIITAQPVGLTLDNADSYAPSGYQVGDLLITTYQDENNIKRIHYGLHPLK